VLAVTASEFWRRIDFGGEAFWENLEPYPWAASLAKELQEIDRVVIATSPSRSPASYSGKRRWLQKMGLCKLDSMFGSSKWLMSKPTRYLVDDGEHNTSKWDLHGGKAVLVPQPWNHAEPVSNVVDHVCSKIIEFRAWSHHE
jgi:5'(3')-deoxyribonucleotidase